ncbi:MAG TPA: NTP transferase domain-containing protein [Mycobacteriales bacterium]|nr:NTP transferase domain-containing protein [Mycobacteriales bacterium]
MTEYDGVVLAGGSGSRLGGSGKPTLRVGSTRLIDVAIAALAGARRVIAVGPATPTAAPLHWTREQPPGGGPVAALAAGLRAVTSPWVVVLAADLPFVTEAAVAALVAQAAGRGGALAVDDAGRDQPLLACYRTAALHRVVPEPAGGRSMRALVRALDAGAPLARVSLEGSPPPWRDCDTPDQLAQARRIGAARG